MILGFTGTRTRMNSVQLKLVLEKLMEQWHTIEEIHHGCCEGADEQFVLLCKALNFDNIVGHPPKVVNHLSGLSCNLSNKLTITKDYLVRDRDIVNSVDELWATPGTTPWDLGPRSGTAYTIRYAIDSKVSVVIIKPTGEIERVP